MLRGRKGLFILAMSAVLLTGCGSVKIGRILNDPTRYHNKSVSVEGTVTGAAGAMGIGAYQVEDGTGKIYVVSTGSGVPRKGARVKVNGLVAGGVTIMGNSLGTTIRERSHKVRD
jgi:hypothetical protein